MFFTVGMRRWDRTTRLKQLAPVAAVCLLAGALAAGFGLAARSIEFVAPLNDHPSAAFEFGPLEPGAIAAQTIGGIPEGLTAVSVLAVAKGAASPTPHLTVRVRADASGPILREKTLPIPQSAELREVTFAFERLPGSPGGLLQFVATSAEGAQVYLGATRLDRYPDGRLFYRDWPVFADQDVGVQLQARTSVWRLLGGLRSRSEVAFAAAAVLVATFSLLLSLALASVLRVSIAGRLSGRRAPVLAGFGPAEPFDTPRPTADRAHPAPPAPSPPRIPEEC